MSRADLRHHAAPGLPERSLVRGVVSGARSAEHHVAESLQSLRDHADLNLLVGAPMDSALERAWEIDQARSAGRALGSLAGLPIVVKDNIAVAGRPLTGGSPALDGYRPPQSAGTVARLVEAGAIVVGQTNMHELALGVTSDNATHGPVRNPYDPTRMAGGSSGGTAAAIGAGAVLAGLATDTGGSGRIPAAWCGTVGFRPSEGRYPPDGVLTLSRTMDAVAVMTRSLDGLALLDAVLAADAGTAVPEPTELRLGVPVACWDRLSGDVLAGFEDAVDRFRAAGVVLQPVDLADISAVNREIDLPLVAHEVMDFWAGFAAHELGSELSAFALRLASPDVAERFAAFARFPKQTADDSARLLAGVRTLRALHGRLFAELHLDALVFPTVPVTAPRVGATTVRLPSGEHDIFQALTASETPASLAGIPALTVPAGRDREGLPFGIELDGPRGSDRRLIAIGDTLAGLLPDSAGKSAP